ncbi:MAG: hypothetical protein SGI72_16925 [Planctomycetota bacterium]|nr:hypothetical protein [Planctomycetota bacterium]
MSGLLWIALCLPVSALQTANPSQDVIEAIKAIEIARARCDWREMGKRAKSVRSLVSPRSDDWFTAALWEAQACNELWLPEELERSSREALAAVAELRIAEPNAKRSAIGPLSPGAAGSVAGLEILLAHVLQSRRQHVEALGHLRFVLDDLSSGPCEGAEGLMALAGLDAAKSLFALGRYSEARSTLNSLRERLPGSREAAHASVLLQWTTSGIGAYRGKFAGDKEQERRMRAVLAMLPRASARCAAGLGLKSSDFPAFPVGFVDLPPEMPAFGALTDGDPRRPSTPAAIMIFSEPIALDMLDWETILVHELTHAALMATCGPAYHRLPYWLVEGLSEAIAAQTEASMDFWIANLLAMDAEAFFSPHFWKLHPLVFEDEPCAPSAAPGASFAILPLVESKGLDGVRGLIARIGTGRSLDEAFRGVMGIDVAEYLKLARARVQAVLDARRESSVIAAQRLTSTAKQGPASVLRCADEVLQELASLPTESAYGFASWKRAEALARLGLHEEALAAFRGLHAMRHAHPSYVEIARIGEASALISLGRREEAVSRLESLKRDAMTPDAVRLVSAEAAKLR